MVRLVPCVLAFAIFCTASVSSTRTLLESDETPDSNVLVLPGDDQPSTLRSRIDAVAVDNTVILTQTSCGYLEFAINWIQHIVKLDVTNWLTIVEDAESLEYINNRFPGHAIAASEFTSEALASGSGLYEYGSTAFTRLACARPVYLQTILDMGYSVVWSDTDTVWLKDFVSLAPKGLDYVGVDDSEKPEQETDNACTGLMYMNPTEKAKSLLQQWHDTCQEQQYLNQPAWNHVFSQEARREMDYYIMPRATYPHGMLTSQVYSYDPNYDELLASLGLSPDTFDPAWVHANFRVGRSAKRAFLKERNVWDITHDDALPQCSLMASSAHHS